MRKNDDFIIREIAGKYVLIPFGKNAIDFNGVITINDTAKFLWENCDDGEINIEMLQNALITEYKIDADTAKKAVEVFINQLRDAGCIDE